MRRAGVECADRQDGGRASSTDYLHRLEAVTSALAEVVTAPQALQVIVEQCRRTFELAASIVYLRDGDELVAAEAWGLLDSEPRRIGLETPRFSTAVVATGRPLFLATPAELRAANAELARHVIDLGGAAVAALPLVYKEDLRGVLVVTFAQERTFSRDERLFLSAVAGQCSLALERARLLDAEREAHLRFQREQHKFVTATENAIDPFLLYRSVRDAHGRLVDLEVEYYNAAAFRGNRPARQIRVGMRLLRDFPDQAGARLFPAYRRVIETGEPYGDDGLSFERDTGDGRKVATVIDIRAVKLEDGVAVRWRDITARRLAEQRLRDHEIKLAAIFENTSQFLGLLAPDGTVLELNRAILGSAGVDRGPLIGTDACTLPWCAHSTAAQARLRDAIRRAAGGEAVRYEIERPGPDGRPITVDFSLTPVRDGSGRIVYLLPEGRDITERKALERLRQEWISVVTHDLRAPLSAIVINTELVARQGHEEVARSVGGIRRSVHRLGRMIQDLSDFSRVEAQRLKLALAEVDVRPLVEEVIDRARAETTDRPVACMSAGRSLRCRVDGDRIQQVVDNLLTNAVKYGAPGTPIEVTLAAGDGQAILSVANQGPGIRAEELPRLFDRFYRTRSAQRTTGLGLGLYIARGIVEAHGGRIDARSTPGEVTTFEVRLPLARARRARGLEPVRDTGSSSGSRPRR